MMDPLLPMLAMSASPFDSRDYIFEVKWDGVRALAAVEKGRWRLWGRELANYDGRYPELDVLRRLPAGTIVDGELVAFRDNGHDVGLPWASVPDLWLMSMNERQADQTKCARGYQRSEKSIFTPPIGLPRGGSGVDVRVNQRGGR